MLRWAADRAGLSLGELRNRFAKYDEWLSGAVAPTFNQLQDFARATYTSFGYFFLAEPPALKLPIPDFRTPDNRRPDDPSPNLLDTIGLCQQRQEWYASYARSVGTEPLPFVGTLTVQTEVSQAADAIREAIGLDLSVRRHLPKWEDALRDLIRLADDAGILVMTSGVVGNNTDRALDLEEFRGFALIDRYAPLVFVNGRDTLSARMFTLAHELAHVWLGQSALSDATAAQVADDQTERWCNAVAAEVLVPIDSFRREYWPTAMIGEEMQRLAKVYKVSTLVVLRRMYDAGGMTYERFRQLYREEATRLVRILQSKAGGGDPYRTTISRVSPRLTRAVVTSALEGRSSLTEAFRLLGCRSMRSFIGIGAEVGIDAGGSVV